ncbi:MAG: hypothetical protein P4L36_09920 [Holophaga sp.]|nr:hypothetical protein [Holophaga sp.]
MRRLVRSPRPRPRPGAYETPGDVAGYLAENTLIPALLESTRDGCPEALDALAPLLRRDPGRYLRAQLRHGLDQPLPGGVDPRARADPALGLPRETWAEAAARRRRCARLLERLGGPEPGICDLVLANLDLGRLALDLLAQWGPGPALAFWHALERLTVLDPTCGSGACLAAAAKVLEPLHAACLARLALLAGGSGFQSELQAELQAALRAGAGFSPRDTLHGVDIQEDALDRCRARLGPRVQLRAGDALLGPVAGPFQAGALPWSSAFPQVMAAGGFQVILGNPPYARIPREADRPMLRTAYRSAGPRWSALESLATLALERCLRLLRPGTGRLGLVLPLAVACSTGPAFAALRRVIRAEPGLWLWSHFDRTPNALFGRAVRTRCSLALYARSPEVPGHRSATTGLLRWNAQARGHLFATLHYARLELDISTGIPKVADQLQADVLQALLAAGAPLGRDLQPGPGPPASALYVGGSAYNWFPAWRELPETFDRRGRATVPARVARFACASEEAADLAFALLCSSLGYWWWAVAGDGFNLKQWLVLRFPLSLAMIPGPARAELARLGRDLRQELRRHYVTKRNRGRIGNFLLPACREQILALDRCLGASVPGLSPAFMEDIRASNAAFSEQGREPV